MDVISSIKLDSVYNEKILQQFVDELEQELLKPLKNVYLINFTEHITFLFRNRLHIYLGMCIRPITNIKEPNKILLLRMEL